MMFASSGVHCQSIENQKGFFYPYFVTQKVATFNITGIISDNNMEKEPVAIS